MRVPKLVAVLNVTPDSFSDDGSVTPEAIIEKALRLIDEGTDVLDVGAESTRPDATPLTAEKEWARLEPVWAELYALCQAKGALLSLDSYHPETVRRALAIGADWVNDVRGFSDAAMVDAVRDSSCRLVVMHSLIIPAEREVHLPLECDVIAELQQWSDARLAELREQGIASERVILDPGIGFGKTAEQSLDVLMRVDKWERNGAELFVGHSRKSFMTLFDKSLEAHERDGLTRAFSAMLAYKNVDYLRVHDVAGHRGMFCESI